MPKPAIFRNGKRRKPTNAASDVVLRKIWLLLELLRYGHVTFEEYHNRYGRDFRSLQRDLQQLRGIGEQSGFALSTIKDGNRVDLERFDSRLCHGSDTTNH